jgi:5,10-methylenetetrahydromethanopterin reductase
MRFGIRFIEYVGNSHDLVRLTVAAEEAGFDSVWFPHDPYMRNTWVLTSAVACQTSKIEIGSVGTNPYSTDPSEIATYLATLDELSDGRALLGLGLHATVMVEWSGFDASNHMKRTEEATELIRRLLKGEVVDYAGAEFNWSDQCYLRFEPRRDTVPIYTCAFGTEFLELSGRIGDGSLPMITPPASAANMVPPIRKGLAQNPRAGSFVISGCAWLSLSETREAAAANMRRMVAYFGPYFEEESLAHIGLTSADMQPLKTLVQKRDYEAAYETVTDDMLRLGIVGTPDDVIREIEMLAALGVDEINLGGPLGPDPEEAIRLMGSRVIPYFRG